MKPSVFALALLGVCLSATLTSAQTDIYDNGPINGTTDAWSINGGFAVSDSFTLNTAATVNGLNFAAWLFPGDVLDTVAVSITSSELGGTSFFNQTVHFTQSDCVSNQLGYNVCDETASLSGVNLNAGTYWLNLANATTNTSDDPVYWDENSGPSSASQNTVGSIPSESFTVLGITSTSSTSSTSSATSTPEPSSIMLFGSGVLGVAGLLRRKLF